MNYSLRVMAKKLANHVRDEDVMLNTTALLLIDKLGFRGEKYIIAPQLAAKRKYSMSTELAKLTNDEKGFLIMETLRQTFRFPRSVTGFRILKLRNQRVFILTHRAKQTNRR